MTVRTASFSVVLFLGSAAFAMSCGRTELDPFDVPGGNVTGAVPDPTAVVPPSPTATLTTTTPDPTPEPNPTTPDPTPDPTIPDPTPDPVPTCVPSTEICNGVDDDCNGRVDDVPPEQCQDGGFSYCVAGRRSDCPKRCEACLPGSERVCQLSYCTYWGVESCSADGKAFSFCKEQRVPRECRDIALRFQDSPELERCCIDNGYCCLDSHDLDQDGDTGEMVGRCESVMCQAASSTSPLP